MGAMRLVLFLLVVYSFLVIIVYFMQRSLQYFPSNDMGDPRLPEQLKMQVVTIKTEDGLDNVSWFAPPKEKNGKIIVVFHGNGGNISHRDIKAARLTGEGYGVLLCGYRGYGRNPGNPTETGLYRDARATVKWLEKQGYNIGQMVFYGESLGSGVAIQMATEFNPKHIILEAPFSSALSVAKRHYFYLPVDYMMKDRYDSLAKIGKVKASLLIVHGTLDGVIPISEGRKLFEAANHPKEFITIENAGHNNLYEMQAGLPIAGWLEKQITQEKQP